MTDARYTTSTAFLEALREAGIRYAFSNLGSDHTGFIEAYSQAARLGTLDQFPELVICPHESVALSAAHGYAQISGEPQAVLVHTDVGTQSLGGAVHNASRGRVPVLIFAGLSPVTQDGELRGTRTEHIHWLQDTVDQRGMLRGYVKHDQEIRTGRNVKQLVHRAVQLARSEPAGPVYLVAAREVMEEGLPPQPAPGDWWAPVAPAALVPEVTDEIAAAIEDARDPLVVTSYLGRDPAAVPALAELCELAAIAVVESAPSRLNFPADHPLHLGFHWNRPAQEPVLAQADVILVAGSDVPWIPAQNRPSGTARIFMVDIDPVKTQLPLWYIPASRYAMADPAVAIRQLTARLRERGRLDPAAVAARADRVAGRHRAQRAEWAARERPGADDVITPAYLVACVREAIGPDAVVLTETVSNYPVVSEHLRSSQPGGLFGSGGGSLGWAGGAAVGSKLAAPDRLVVSLVGDGSYLFGVPASAHWVARRYQAPSLTVIFDNQGWRAPYLSASAVHPDGEAVRGGFSASFQPEADLAEVAAAAGGAYARTVIAAARLPETLREALAQVAAGRSAVVSVHLPPASAGLERRATMARLDSKVALITGGESGIGLATARLFVAEGARVHLAGLVRSRLADAVAELGPDVADFSVTDVTVEEQVSCAVEQAVGRFGALDVLFSNAGISGDIAPIAEYPADVFRRVLDVHVLGAFFVLKHGLPVLRDGGSVIINSSVVGLTSDAGICAYATAKHAQVGLMRTAAKEMAGRGIRVNTVHPGPTDTQFQRDIEVSATGAPPDVAARIFEARIPLARHACADEIARSVLYLASQDSSFVTGAALAVDGGMHI